jgi:hypothetical protein
MGIVLPNPRKKDIFFDTQKLGRVYIFPLVLGDFGQFRQEIRSVEKTTPLQYVKALIKHVCHREEDLVDREYRPEKPSLGTDEINLISESEIDEFAEKYITKAGLNKKWISKHRKNEEGVNSVTLEQVEAGHPRDEGENWVDYLYRLAVIQEKELNESFQKIAKEFESINSFSKTLQEQIKNTFSLGDSLKKSFESFRVPEDIISETYKPPLDYSEIAKIKPFGGLPDKIDKLIETSANSADFLIEMNRTQTGIANELKSSGEKAARYSKLTIATGVISGIIIIGLTILTIYLTNSSLRSSDNQNLTLNKSMETVGNELKSLNENTRTMLRNNKMGFEELIQKDADPKGANQKLLLKLIEQQNLIISELKNIREQDRSRIELLERQLRELSQKIKEQEKETGRRF